MEIQKNKPRERYLKPDEPRKLKPAGNCGFQAGCGRSWPTEPNRSIRLNGADIEQLQARAYTVSATMTGTAGDLIRAGLAGSDNKTLADQLMKIERRIVALEQQGRDTNERMHSIDRSTGRRAICSWLDGRAG